MNKGSYIYLASPYSNPDPAVMHERFEKACEAVAWFINAGHTIYSPIVHNHPVAVRHALPRGMDFWYRFDLCMLRPANSLIVLKLPGFEVSRGVLTEISFAEQHQIPVEYLEPNTWQISVKSSSSGATSIATPVLKDS